MNYNIDDQEIDISVLNDEGIIVLLISSDGFYMTLRLGYSVHHNPLTHKDVLQVVTSEDVEVKFELVGEYLQMIKKHILQRAAERL